MRNGAFRLVAKRSKTSFLLNSGEYFLLNNGNAMFLNDISARDPQYSPIPHLFLNTGVPLRLNSGKFMILSEI